MRTWMLHKIGFLAVVLAGASGCGSNADEPAGQAGSGGTGATGGASGGSGGSGGQAGAGGSAGTPATCPEGFPMKRLSGKPVIDVMIGDQGPFAFVYDTGAPDSGIDPALTQKVGGGPYTLKLGGKQVDVDSLVSFPVQQYLNSKSVWGVIGANVMRNFAVTLDDQRSRFWLDDQRDEDALLACAHAQGKPVAVSYVEADYLFVPGKAENKPGWFLVDTGASLGAMPKGVFSELQAAHPRPALDGFYTPAAVGTFWAQLTAIGALEVAGQKVEHIVTRTIDDAMIPTPKLDAPFLGVLPTGYLRHFLMTVDYPAGELRLDGYADLPPREPDSFFAVGIGFEQVTSPPIHVTQVLAGSSAADEGIAVGDELVKVSGQSFADLTPYQRPWSLLDQSEHAPIPVTVLRGGKEISVTLETRKTLTDPKLD
ncbi:MAG: PDZ domain-containing protein [Polyangiaceae bacterium]|nr:PDZ domain-containing protein [Polyangiaceae bacterium]